MKKNFKLTHPTVKAARVADRVRCDVRKYVKRERRRELPDGVDFWDFDCRCGPTEKDAVVVHVTELGSAISAAEAQNLESLYIEVMAKPGKRTKKPAPKA